MGGWSLWSALKVEHTESIIMDSKNTAGATAVFLLFMITRHAKPNKLFAVLTPRASPCLSDSG